jgi:prepilin-type processing-associated H-X9-DG protein
LPPYSHTPSYDPLWLGATYGVNIGWGDGHVDWVPPGLCVPHPNSAFGTYPGRIKFAMMACTVWQSNDQRWARYCAGEYFITDW